MKRVFLSVSALLLLTAAAGISAAADENSRLEIGGDYRFRYDHLTGNVHDYMQFTSPTTPPVPVSGYEVKNNALMTNRLGLNLKAMALEDVVVKARLVMFKVWGHETSTPIQGSPGFFADRAFGEIDGTVGHVPADDSIKVDYAYATWSNIADAPVWFSIGRRPSTGGIPSILRQNAEKIGTAGLPTMLVDFAFDGLTLGAAPDIEALPGAYAKACYGKGLESGYKSPANPTLKDTDFLGLNAVPYDTENLHVEVLYMKAWNVMDAPSDGFNSVDPATGAIIHTPVSANLGDMQWLGGVVSGKIDALNLFVAGAASKSDPNDNRFGNLPNMPGLLWSAARESHTGSAVFAGGRYDIASSGTKIGAEYNHGSQYWFGMVPAGDDIVTSKLGTRGDVYEVYLIQELQNKPLAKKGKAFFRAGYQYYKFNYTGSNSWLGAPVKIADLDTTNMANAQMFAPLKDAKDIYLTFDVRF